mgnify:CR=1 FL=1
MPCTVLIVDDERDTNDILASLVRGRGFEAIQVYSGAKAFEAIEKAKPDLILLDLMMPNMDGWEFRAEQRRNREMTPVPTVILSADGNVDQNMEALQADGYLRKPIHIKTLLQLVERFCGPPPMPQLSA